MVRPTLDIEKSYWNKDQNFVCGIDEVGRGSWVGPLVVAGVILDQTYQIHPHLADSKLVTPKRRKELSVLIKKQARGYYIAQVSAPIIDKVGIAKATQMAFRKVANSIRPLPNFVLIDAFYIKHFNRKKQLAVKDGDKVCASIAAASIIAKVYRDELMERLHLKYPNYFFDKNKGYGTKRHQLAIKEYGLSPIHRQSYNLAAFL